MRRTTAMMSFVVAMIALVASGCAATPAEHSYITDYQVLGDKSVKYIYLPGEESRAGGGYLDQGLAVEICSLEPEAIESEEGEEGEEGDEAVAEGGDGEGEAVDDVEADDTGEGEAEEVSEADRTRYLTAETDCEQTRLLLTEEFR